MAKRIKKLNKLKSRISTKKNLERIKVNHQIIKKYKKNGNH